MSDLREFLTAQLTLHGYSGLAGDGCGCTLDCLGACESPNLDECSPGYRHECNDCPNQTEDNECEMVEDGGVGSCVSSSKDWPTP